MAPAAAVLSITEERTFSAKLGDRTITDLAVSSAWEGLTKYTDRAGQHLIVLDAEQRVITASPDLIGQLAPAVSAAAGAHPAIGSPLAGGIYAGLTELDGQLAHLVLMPGEKEAVSWGAAMAWAAETGHSVPTRKELITLYENLKSEFANAWYWSCQQHAGDAVCAWLQDFLSGFQTSDHKSCAGRARAVRRLPI